MADDTDLRLTSGPVAWREAETQHARLDDPAEFNVYEYGRPSAAPFYRIRRGRVYQADGREIMMIDADAVIEPTARRPCFKIVRNIWYDLETAQPAFFMWPADAGAA